MTDSLCEHLSNGSAAIVYFSNTEKFGRSTAASQYFLQMAGFLGIPVIAWNADNNGLEKVSQAGRGGRLSLCKVSSLDMLARVVRLVKDESRLNSTPETYIYCIGGSCQPGQKKISAPRRTPLHIACCFLLFLLPLYCAIHPQRLTRHRECTWCVSLAVRWEGRVGKCLL